MFNRGITAQALIEQGCLDQAEDLLARTEGAVDASHFLGPAIYLTRGRLRLAQHRPAEALADALAVGGPATRAGWLAPAWLRWRSQAAAAYLMLGDRDRARALADEELELARGFGAPRTLGDALTAVGVAYGGGRGEDALREAIEQFERGHAELGRARAMCDLGAQLRRANQRKESRALLRDALDVAHRLGAAPLARRAETELRATGARPRRAARVGVDALTASERRVADLAAEGMTNRQIGQALFVTGRTVEGHLTAVFRKLDVESREQLPGALR